jgi:NTE family protein
MREQVERTFDMTKRKMRETKNNNLAHEKTKRSHGDVSSKPTTSSTPKKTIKNLENVLILQGGGSLGAFGCGVFKALAKRNMKIDIVAGTSIGGVNAAIIAGAKDQDHSEQLLEQFWLELSDGFVDLSIDFPLSYFSDRRFIGQFLPNYYNSLFGGKEEGDNQRRSVNEKTKIKQLRSFYSSAIFGNDKMFKPRWSLEYAKSDPEYFTPQKWTYLYDHSPLAKTLDKYIDYKKLSPTGNPNARLIITATNLLNSQALVFDSSKQQITPKHILAASGYPLYNFPWIEVENGVYAWDGGLLSNTPLREAIDASPINDKWVFLVENYPKKIDALPTNLPEVYHRARDIMFSDKTEHNVAMSKLITRYLQYIDELYQIVEAHADEKRMNQDQLKRIRQKYKRYKEDHGAEIKKIFHISREEPFPHIYENADFSPETIKSSINEGETKTNEALRGLES